MPTIYKPERNRKNEEPTEQQKERREIYNTRRWRNLRRIKFDLSPLCELCLKEGKIVPAEDVHHVVSFMSTDDAGERYRLAFDIDNLQSLCKKHHQRLHNERRY